RLCNGVGRVELSALDPVVTFGLLAGVFDRGAGAPHFYRAPSVPPAPLPKAENLFRAHALPSMSCQGGKSVSCGLIVRTRQPANSSRCRLLVCPRPVPLLICHQPLRSSSRIARLTLRGSKPVSAASVSIRVTATCYAVHVPIEQNKAGGERAGREDVGAHHRIIKIEPGYQGVGAVAVGRRSHASPRVSMVSGLAPFSGAIKPAAAQLGEYLDPIAAVEAVNQEIAVAIAESEIVALAQ